MYAGQLHEAYGLRVILDAFAMLHGDGYALWLFGQGTMEQEIREAAAADPRIMYGGFQPAEVILPRTSLASVMVNPRPLEQQIAPYSFPSKLLEYLAMGKIVISTELPGIPPDYYPHLIFFDNMSAASLAERIAEVAGRTPQRRQEMERAARAFAWGSKTQLHQGRRMVQFLRDVGGGTCGT